MLGRGPPNKIPTNTSSLKMYMDTLTHVWEIQRLYDELMYTRLYDELMYTRMCMMN